MKLSAIPIETKHANKVVGKYHRHSRPVVGAKFSIGVIDENLKLWGVAIVGRPVTRLLDDGYTSEVLRVCVLPDAPKGSCSFLYAKSWQAWRAMGGRRIITYTLETENGASLRGAGWQREQATPPGSVGWNRPSRPREEREIYTIQKNRWSKTDGDIPAIHPKNFRLFSEDDKQQSFEFID